MKTFVYLRVTKHAKKRTFNNSRTRKFNKNIAMFGITHKLIDPALYIYHDMVEDNLLKMKEKLSTYGTEKNEDVDELNKMISIYEHELLDFENEISSLKSENFQFSVEELYYMYGQYENRFIDVEFHKLSDTAKKFGRNIGGDIIYSKSERERLEILINSGKLERTNGLVKLDVSPNYNIPGILSKELSTLGFLSGDIFQIHSVNLPLRKEFNKEGIKEIPDTMNIEFDPTGLNPYKLELRLLSNRLNDGQTLIDTEWCKLCGYLLQYEPESINIKIIRERTFDGNGLKKKFVRFYELKAMFFDSKQMVEHIEEFNTLLSERTSDRKEILRQELKKSTKKTLEEFSVEYPDIYIKLENIILTFEDETIELNKTVVPIYWDLKSFLHIYLRHCEELQIEGHFKTKTKFQYTQTNIKSVLSIVVDKLSNKINTRLLEGNDFRSFGDKSLYFNGNHYTIRIEKTGRIDSFFPLENKDLQGVDTIEYK